MTPVKIKNIYIKGIRGIKEDLELPLDKKSVLIYGDNGSGKSSVTDAIEWFYRGRIDHLSVEEIGKLGLEALRNVSIKDTEMSMVDMKYSDASINCSRNIGITKGAIKIESTNATTSFTDYIKESQKENLFLRYRELVDFILSTKSQKLVTLFDIIGFAGVTGTKQILKKTLNDLARELKNKNFDGSINIQQSNLLKTLKQNITSQAHFIKAINELIIPFGIGKTIKNMGDIDAVVTAIKKPTDTKIIEQQIFYTQVKDFASNFKLKLNSIDETYKDYERKYNKLSSDLEMFKKIVLSELLRSGEKILRSAYYTDNNCPLCLQPKDYKNLLKEIQTRIVEIKKARSEQDELNNIGRAFKELLNGYLRDMHDILKNKYFKDDVNSGLKEKLDNIIGSIRLYLNELDLDLERAKTIRKSKELRLNNEVFSEIERFSIKRHDDLKAKVRDDKATDVVVDIEVSKSAFKQIENLKKEKELIERQKTSVEFMFEEYSRKYKEGIESFINKFSNIINEYYQFMNPGEPIKDIKLKLLESDDEVIGMTISYKYLDSEVAPPQKYFSESHLNCFGLSLFLASARAFNHKNNFIIMDDVISSFDTNHRKRFADLLIEKFEDYQVILFTHERQWFEYVTSIVRNKNWMVNEIRWSTKNGAYLVEDILNLKGKIENKFANKLDDDLGNNIRVYLEHILKEIAANVRVKMEFRYNEFNENRMSHELLSELKGKILKASDDLKNKIPLIDRTLSSTFIGNKGSHDSSYQPSRGDLMAFWKDVQDIETTFYCDNEKCKKWVSMKYYDQNNKKIKCKCGGIVYSWKL